MKIRVSLGLVRRNREKYSPRELMQEAVSLPKIGLGADWLVRALPYSPRLVVVSQHVQRLAEVIVSRFDLVAG